MPQPPAYNRTKDFTENFGSETDHTAINAELDAASNSINDIRTNLALMQADDGKIKQAAITTDSLSTTVKDFLINEVSGGIVVYRDQAATSASNAGTSETNAANSATASANSASNSSASATLSQNWATKTDAEVVVGQGYGAKKYANDAAASAASVQSYIDHVSNTANPHAVTKAQVGLGSADNTADLDKPVSTATQTALNSKVSTTGNESVAGIKTFTDNVNLTSLNGGPLAGLRNKIINGNFDVWQRGTSQTSSDYGSDDRWININVGSTKTHSRQGFTNGQTDVPGGPAFFSRTVVSSVAGADNAVNKTQRIENVRLFSGKTVTLSFYAKADANRMLAVDFLQFFGTGGSPSSPVDGIAATKFSLTTNWQKFTITATLPSIAGKSLGSNLDHYTAVRLWFDAGTSFNTQTNSLGHQSGTFDIAQVQLEEGSVATPFEQRPIGLELMLCQRYYWKSTTGDGYPMIWGNSSGNGGLLYAPVCLPVTMRALPSVSTVGTWTIGGTAISNPPTVNYLSTQGFSIGTSCNAAGQGYVIPNSAGCFVSASAEL